VIRNEAVFDGAKLDRFTETIARMRERGRWEKTELTRLFHDMIPEFEHKETGKYLDGKM